MISDERFERLLAEVLEARTPPRPPDRLIPETLRAVRETRRWPRWLALLKEPPMRISDRLAIGSPTARVSAILMAMVFLMLVSSMALVAGASLLGPPEPTAEESELLSGMRLDLQGACLLLRHDLPEAALAAIECDPGAGPSAPPTGSPSAGPGAVSSPSDAASSGAPASRVRVYLFETQQALLETYLARLVAQGVEPGTAGGRCVPGQASEGPYTPFLEDGLEVAERGGCYVDEAGLAHYLATNPPFVLIELDGTTGDMAALEAWAWLGNEDQPGNPTVWRESPVDTEK